MKILTHLLTAGSVLCLSCQLFGAAAAASKTPVVDPNSTAAVTAIVPKSSDADCLKLYGWALGQQSGAKELNLSADELALVTSSFTLGCEGKDAPVDPSKVGPGMQDFLQGRYEVYSAALAKKLEEQAKVNKAAAQVYFDKLANNKKVTKTASGLYYEVLTPGKAPKPTAQDMVEVNYEGKLIDGTKFDSSYDRSEPTIFSLEGIIPGAREGLQLIGEGGKIRLFIPSDLGYGDRDIPSIPPGSALIFEFELIKINPPELVIETDQVDIQVVPEPAAASIDVSSAMSTSTPQ